MPVPSIARALCLSGPQQMFVSELNIVILVIVVVIILLLEV